MRPSKLPDMPILSDDELAWLLPPSDLIESVRHAMLWDEQNPGQVPQRMHINRGTDTFLFMPAFGPGVHGTKLVSVLPANRLAGRPIISGTYLLFDSQTGDELLQTSAAGITALRTGAIAAVAVDVLAPNDIDSVGIIGCGVQATAAARLMAHVRPVKTLYCHSRRPESVDRLREAVAAVAPDVRVQTCADSREVLDATSTVITATTSPHPVLPDDARLLEGKTFIAMGAYRSTMRELPDAVFRLTDALTIDAEGARRETGDALYPVENKLLDEQDVFTLGKVMLGLRRLKSSTRVFKSAGYALFDLFTAHRAWEKCNDSKMPPNPLES